MKRLFTAVLAGAMMFLGTNAFAQLSQGESRMSAGGGFTGFNLSGADSKGILDGVVPGYYFGASLEYAFSTVEGLTVEPGLYVAHYGKSLKYAEKDAAPYRANYIRLPADLKYTFFESDGLQFAGFTGPRFNLGLVGKMFENTDGGFSGLKRLDVQWGAGVSATIQDAIILRVGLDKGLTKCMKKNDVAKVYRDAFCFGVNFVF